jgi:putative copper resistance protein D
VPLVELTRWALYLDLGLLFGVPTAALLLRIPDVLEDLRRTMLVVAAAAVPLTLLGFWVLVADMAGTSLANVDSALILDLAIGSALGWAVIVRLVVLVAALIVLASPAFDKRWLVLPSAAALATLAWSGHAASGEGASGMVRIIGDVVHLGAASIWLGALALFAALLASGNHRPVLPTLLARFAGVGTILVALLVATGMANLQFVAPSAQWFILAATPYGCLLAIKLGLFAAMLVLAAINRFVLVPRLAGRNDKGARSSFMLTVFAELGCAIAVLLSVAYLGHLDPIAG